MTIHKGLAALCGLFLTWGHNLQRGRAHPNNVFIFAPKYSPTQHKKRYKMTHDQFSENISDMKNLLASQGTERERRKPDLTLQRIADSVTPMTAVLKKLKNQTAIKLMLGDALVAAAKDDLWCPDTALNPHAEQTVNCYCGDQWMTVSAPQWKSFIHRMAKNCGLSADLLDDDTFMPKVYRQAAFRVFKNLHPVIKDDELWLNMASGTLEIKSDGTVIIREHRREDHFFYCLQYPYNPEADCQEWIKTLDRILPDPKAQLLLAEIICYCLMRSHRFERWFLFHGSGANGKSTVLQVIESLLGTENISNLSLDDLTNDETKRADFEHTLANIAYETGRNINGNVLKLLASGEPVTVELKYCNPRQIRDYGKILVATNQLPKAENTPAFFRRAVVLPFEVTIPREEQDLQLADRLKKELSGILNWALQALPGLIERQAFTTCEGSERALEAYKLSADSVKLFASDLCEKSEQEQLKGQFLFDTYRQYCTDAGIKNAVGRTEFYRRLEAAGFKPIPNGNNGKLYHIKLKE